MTYLLLLALLAPAVELTIHPAVKAHGGTDVAVTMHNYGADPATCTVAAGDQSKTSVVLSGKEAHLTFVGTKDYAGAKMTCVLLTK